MKTLAKFLILAFSIISGGAIAGTIDFTVTHPTQYEDNTPLSVTDISQTRIEYSICAGGAFGTKLGEVVIAGNGTTTSKSGLVAADYCSRGYTTAKNVESVAGTTLVKTVPQAAPKPPTLSATVRLAMTVKHTKDHGWDLVQNIGETRIGAECDETQPFGNGFYALKDPQADVTPYAGQARKLKKTIATQCS